MYSPNDRRNRPLLAALVAAVATLAAAAPGQALVFQPPILSEKLFAGTGHGGNSMAVADFTGDRRDDLAVADWGGFGALVLPAQEPDPSDLGAVRPFGPKERITAGVLPIAVAAVDADADAGKELAVLSSLKAGKDLAIMKRGASGWSRKTRIETDLRYGLDLVAADFNNDGRQDLAAIGLGGAARSFLQQSDGSFKRQDRFTSGPGLSFVGGMAAVDVDGDGDQDLVAGYSKFLRFWQRQSVIYQALVNDGTGRFSRGTARTVGTRTFVRGRVVEAVVVADVTCDKDAKPEVLGVSWDGTIAVMETGDTKEQLKPPTKHAVSPFSTRIVIADFNRDGRKDAVVSSQVEKSLTPWEGNAEFTSDVCVNKFKQTEKFGLVPTANAIRSLDVNGDGYPELVGVGWASAKLATVYATGKQE